MDNVADTGNDVATANFVNRMAGAEQPKPPSQPFQQAEKTDLLEFLYAWPAQASAVPQIDEKLRKDMESGKADALKMAADDRKSAQQSDFPFHAHSLETAGPSPPTRRASCRSAPAATPIQAARMA